MAVAQLVEQSLAIPQVRGSNPIIDINDQYFTNCNLEKIKIKEKVVGNGPSLKKLHIYQYMKLHK